MGSWPEFSETLASVSSGFAQIPAAVDGKPAPWVKVRLNRLGVGLDAVRFTNTSDYPADLLWAFTFPSKVRGNWYIVPEEGSLRGFSDFHRKQNLQLAGLDLPDQNIVIFQQLGGGQLLPGGRYILWFDFESGLPVDLHVKLHLVKPDPDKYPHFRSAHPIAKSLGLELPLRFTPAAPLADRADDLAQQGSFEAALTLVDAEVAKGGNRDADFLHARLQQDYAMALGQQAAEREKAHALFLKSAESMRALQGKYGQLTAPETQFLQTAMYNEACSWALAGQAEKALNSLREAIKAGFRDAGHLLADEDLRAVRELPAFEEIMRQMDEPP
jgi:hypothetical protein